LFETLTTAHVDSSFGKLLSQLAKTDVLILDEWGLDKHKYLQKGWMLSIMVDKTKNWCN